MKKSIIALVLLVLSAPLFTLAQTPPPVSALGQAPTSGPTMIGVAPANGTPYTTTKFVTTVLNLVDWFSWLIAVAAVVMGLYSGWLFITAADNASQIASARKVMLYAIIGIAVAILAFGLIAISRSLLGL